MRQCARATHSGKAPVVTTRVHYARPHLCPAPRLLLLRAQRGVVILALRVRHRVQARQAGGAARVPLCLGGGAGCICGVRGCVHARGRDSGDRTAQRGGVRLQRRLCGVAALLGHTSGAVVARRML